VPINSRAKGAAGERELANFLTKYGYPARRGQQFQGTSESPDIICEELDGWHIECKRVQQLNLHKAFSKCFEECSMHQSPVVMHRKNGEEWLATISLSAFLELQNRQSVNQGE
jgi:Holliday junction resolvase